MGHPIKSVWDEKSTKRAKRGRGTTVGKLDPIKLESATAVFFLNGLQ